MADLPAVLPTRTRFATTVGGAVGQLSRRLGRGGGSVIGGRAILALDPGALGELAAGRSVALVSGTNGKTTTTSLLRAALETVGSVATNAQGANLPPGLAAALAGTSPSARAVLEVDEAWLGRVVHTTHPSVVVLLNLSRDQLDRNNEVRRLAAGWRAIFLANPAVTVVANGDDPLVAWAASTASDVVWVGAGQPWTADAAGCPSCGGSIVFSSDGWACDSCPLRRPDLAVTIEGFKAAPGRTESDPDQEPAVALADGRRFPVQLRLPGRANLANAAMAMAAAGRLGVEPAPALAAMAGTTEIAGRYRTVRVGDSHARLLLAKNPAGWLEVFGMLAPPPRPVVVVINARIADGRDPSWLWDVPFERLAGRMVMAAGERSRDLAVRLAYAEVDHRHEPDPIAAINCLPPGDIEVVANYTAFQSMASRFAAPAPTPARPGTPTSARSPAPAPAPPAESAWPDGDRH